MPNKVSVDTKFKDNTGKWLKITQEQYNQAVAKMSKSIKNLASVLAPVDSGDLRESGKISQTGSSATITFGGGSVKYARLRHYVNNKNPQTKYYLERAGDAVTKKGIQPYL